MKYGNFFQTSFLQFYIDSKALGFITDDTPAEDVKRIWDSVKVIKRDESYDFNLPYSFCLQKNSPILIPTCIGVDFCTPDAGLRLELKKGLVFMANDKNIIYRNTFPNFDHIIVTAKATENISLQAGTSYLNAIFVDHQSGE